MPRPTRRARARWSPTAATSTGSGAPKRPSSSRVHRKREFGDGGLAACGAGFSPKSGPKHLPAAELRGPLRAQAARSLAAPRAGAVAKSQLAPPGPRHADAAQIDAGRAPADDKAHLLETRRLAKRKRRRQAAQAPRRRSLAPHQPSLERLAVLGAEQSEHGRARAHDKARGRQDREPRLVLQPLASGASSRSKAAAACSRDCGVRSAADDGGEWVKVGAREWTSDRRSRDTPTIRALSLAKA